MYIHTEENHVLHVLSFMMFRGGKKANFCSLTTIATIGHPKHVLELRVCCLVQKEALNCRPVAIKFIIFGYLLVLGMLGCKILHYNMLQVLYLVI